jgi:fructose-bisphosphate aldolase, class II
MLARPHELFQDALAGRFALGAFNTSNLEVTQAIITAAVRQSAPVIVQTSEGALKYAGLKPLTALISSLAAELPVPVVLHLDHGKSLAIVEQCIAAGYTSVMIDASTMPLEENIALVRQVVDFAHRRGAWVEAELGMILGSEGAHGLGGKRTPDEILTDPGQAARFVEQTGTDALAVSVGTIHGAFSGQEYLRFELLSELEKTLPQLPLVLHGASGISDKHLSRAAQTHVCKVNVDTELRLAFDRAVRAYCETSQEQIDPRMMLGPAREAVLAVVEEKIRLFGAAGKAQNLVR